MYRVQLMCREVMCDVSQLRGIAVIQTQICPVIRKFVAGIETIAFNKRTFHIPKELLMIYLLARQRTKNTCRK